MGEETEFQWPENEAECAALARSKFLDACVGALQYWQSCGSDFVTRPEPQQPFVRSWSEAAMQDRSYREVFATLNETQKAKVLELLEHCIRGAVFSTLCTLDQFPHGEVEMFVWDGVCSEGKRRFRIAPGNDELHKEFYAALKSKGLLK